MICKNCKSKKLTKIVTIGKQPLSGFFYSKRRYNLNKYSLDLFECSECGLVQLNNKVKKEKMYGDHYGYQSSMSNLMISHFKKKNSKIKKDKSS